MWRDLTPFVCSPEFTPVIPVAAVGIHNRATRVVRLAILTVISPGIANVPDFLPKACLGIGPELGLTNAELGFGCNRRLFPQRISTGEA